MIKKAYSKTKPTCKVTFTLPKVAAATAAEVKLVGTFNDWNHAVAPIMKSLKNEYKAVVELPAGQNYEFRYLIDGAQWENHWAADAYRPTPFGVDNSVVFVDEVSDIPTPKTTKKVTAKKAASKADDLRKIEGIGLKIAGLLNAEGIVTFADLAKAKKTTLKAILAAAGPRYKMHNPSTWAEQSKLAAKGNWDKLAVLQNELKGGKRK